MNRFEEFVKIAFTNYIRKLDATRSAVLSISAAQIMEQELRKYEEAEKEKERDEARKVLNKGIGKVEVPSIHHIYPWHAAPNAAVAAYTNQWGKSFWLCVRAINDSWEIIEVQIEALILPAHEIASHLLKTSWVTYLEIRPNK